MRRGYAQVLAAVLLVAALGVGIRYAGELRPPEDVPDDVVVVAAGPDAAEDERTDGSYFTLVAEDGAVLDKTSRVVRVGDEFILEDNRHFRVERVVGDTGYAVLIATEKLDWRTGNVTVEGNKQGSVLPVQAQGNRPIAVYHTHTDESFVPSDGTESEPGNGGIYQVGEAFVDQLRKQGVNVVYNKQAHEPHDNDAYRRSRRTAFSLLQKQPAAIIDIHRDGIPDPSSYYTQVEGKPAAKLRFVVGRQNQNMGANLDFAKRLKAFMDEKYPGTVRGIYMASGNYNQDLSPRSILVEMGTYTNSKERSAEVAAAFAEALPQVVGLTTTTAAGGVGGDWTGIILVLLVLIGGGIAFLWISAGSLEAGLQRLRSLFAREWGSMPRPQRKPEPHLRLVRGSSAPKTDSERRENQKENDENNNGGNDSKD